MKKTYIVLLGILLTAGLNLNIKAQLSGTKTIPGDYATLSAAIADLNFQGVGSGGVTLNLATGNPQTAPIGGYSITATGTASDQIIFEGNINTITAFYPQSAGALNDAIFKIIGGDYITIRNFIIQENASNTITSAATNNMTEWGIALLYVTTINGAQNNTISGNTIDLNRTYQNTFGIYSNSTHSSTDVTTSVTATTIAGGNSNLTISGNSVRDVNIGMVVVGPTAAADHNDGLTIGGTSPNANTITNYGTTGTFSLYANLVSGTVNGILVRNTKNINASFNTVASSVGGVTSGTLNGINLIAFSNAPTGTFTNSINNNNISLQSGSALNTDAMNGIMVGFSTSTTTSTLNINNNDFNTFGHTVAGTGAITFISNSGGDLALVTNINSNTFTNMTVNTRGNVTFIFRTGNMPAGSSENVNNNSIVTAFNKTGSGGTVGFYSGTGQSLTGSTQTQNLNNFSNVTVTGGTVISGWSNTEGGSGMSGPAKTITNNTFDNIIAGPNSVTGIRVNFSGGPTLVSNNTVSDITSGGPVFGILMLGFNSTTLLMTVSNNLIGPISSAIGPVTGITTGSPVTNLFKNKIYDLSSNHHEGVVNGISILSGTTVGVFNNLIGNLSAPSTSSSNDAVRGINITSTMTASNLNISYNTIYIPAQVSSGANFSASAIFHTANINLSTARLNMKNNILVNLATPKGTGNVAAFRRSSGAAGTLANFGSTSNNNLFYAGTPGPKNLIYSDGTSTAQTLAAYKSGVFTAGTIAPRDAQSVTENPPFISTIGSSPQFLHIMPATFTEIESGGINITGITDDYDGEIRQGNIGYTGSGTAPDIGADEFDGTIPCTLTATITPNGPTTFCQGGSVILTSNAASSYLWSPGGETTQSITVSSSWSYAVTITDANNCTATSQPTVITINPLPVVTATPDVSICNGGSTTLTAGGATSYGWSPSTGLNTTTGANVIANPSSTTTYTVTGTDANGCTNSATVTVTVNPLPTVTVSPNVSICSGSSTTLTGGGASSYEWSPSTGLNTTTGANVIANPSSTTTYTVTGTDANGCSNSATVTVTVNPLPTVTVSPNVSICSGSSTTLTGNGASSYGWSPSTGLNTTTGANIIANPPSTTTYTVTGTDANGCTNTATVTVTVNPLPTVTVSPNVSICSGSSTTLTGNGASSYGWSPSTGLNTTTGANVIANPSSTTTYTVTGTDANGCSNSATVTVTVNPLPTVTVSPNVSMCSGSSTTLIGSGANSYGWSPSTGLNTTTGANVIANPSSTTTYTVTGTDANGCSNSATVTVTVNPLPTVTVSPNVSMCSGGSTTLIGSGASSYEWSPSTGLNTTTGANVIANPSSTTTYTVTGTNANGCSNSATVIVTVNPLPTVTVSPNVSICSGSSTTLTGSGASSYEWSPSTGLNSATGANVIANPSSTTTYTVTGTNANGCSNSATVIVTVNPLPTVDAGTDQSIYSGCLTQNATLTASVTGGNEPFTYLWSPGGETTQSITVTPSSTTTYTVTVTNSLGCSSSDQVEVEVIPVSISVNAGDDQPIYGGCVTQSATLTASASGGFGPTYLWSPGGATTQSITVSPSNTTTYTVTVTNSLGCSSSDEVVVSVTPVSITVDAGEDKSIFTGCVTQSSTITATVVGGFDPTYLWSPGGATTQSITVSPSTTTIYTVTVTNSFGCSSSDQVVVNVTPVGLSVDAGSDTTIYLGYGTQSTTLTAVSSGGYSPTYLWSPGGATTHSITVSPSTTTVYTVQVTNSIGCIATDEIQVNVYDTRCGNNGNKVLVCHNGITICVSESAISAHLDHGDHLDSCNGGPDNIMGGEIISEIPNDYMLHVNYPNPFNPVTTMKYDLPHDSKVTLKVYDMRGTEIATLVNGQMSAGYYTAKFNGGNLPSGVYFYKLTATSGTEQYVKVMKMVLIK